MPAVLTIKGKQTISGARSRKNPGLNGSLFPKYWVARGKERIETKPEQARVFMPLLKRLAGPWVFLKFNYPHTAITVFQLGKGWGDIPPIFQVISK